MKVINPSVELIYHMNRGEAMLLLETCGRICYQSEHTGTDRFIRQIITKGHESVLEHVSITVIITCDRGVTHEIVRHRLSSYSQESTRYCNYSQDKFGNEITVIKPYMLTEGTPSYRIWESAMRQAEDHYFQMLDEGCSPQVARSVLPNSLKTQIAMTADLREWRHFIKLRATPQAHPQMNEIACMIRDQLYDYLPPVFEDLVPTLK